ncbi:MAG: DUF541 domain-containing protein [Dehalococcoidia bacterium]|nr:MAG: DUF541 domain-containing protein [Dehalococcoidia bacterium]
MSALSRPARRIAAAALGGLALVLVACTPEVNVAAPGPAEASGIAVSGTGTASVKPDIALVNLGIEVTSPTVAEARSKAATTMDALTKAVKGKGVSDADIQTQFFNIYPQYGPPTPTTKAGTPEIVGYTVNNQVQMKIRNLDSVSDVLDTAIAAGGNSIRVNGLQFTVEKPDQYLAKAREEAVQNAKARADVLAKAAGVKVGAPRSISESSGGFPVFDKLQAAPSVPGGRGGGPTPVSPGEEQLSVSVFVVFEIER